MSAVAARRPHPTSAAAVGACNKGAVPQQRSAAKHVFFSWRSLEDVNYPRYSDDGAPVPVAPTKGAAPVLVPRAHLIKTAALDTPHRVYVRCSLYDTRGCCEAGPRCPFVHSVHVDATQDAERRRHRLAKPAACAATPTPKDTPLHVSATPSDRSDCRATPSERRSSASSVLACGEESRSSTPRDGPTPSLWWRHDPYSPSGSPIMLFRACRA